MGAFFNGVNMKTERIVAAAVKHPDGGIYSLAPPARHGEVLKLVISVYKDIDEEAPHNCEQGFITSHWRYVGREQARFIANNAHQTSTRDLHQTELFSEDLW